jgi:hypothetical protein
MKNLTKAGVLALVASAGACNYSFVVRDTMTYRDETRAMLATKDPVVKACYDEQLKTNPAVAGTVVVNFKVQPKTGKLVEPRIDDQQSTAPAALKQCVLGAVDGLALTPADQNEGQGTFRWDFQPRG